MRRPLLPVAAPGLICALLFAFTLSWNEFVYALTFTTAAGQKTITVGVTNDLIRGDIHYWGSLMAGQCWAPSPSSSSTSSSSTTTSRASPPGR